LAEQILKGKELDAEEMQRVSDSQRLRDVYSNRWWNLDLKSYWTMYNDSKNKVIKAGD